jgi:hypothetical protein
MPKRTSTLSLYPWNGGINTSQDEGMLQPGQLTVGDNYIRDYRSGKRRREGIDYDYDNMTFVVTSRSSSGTSRTLTGTFANTGIAVGDKVTIINASNASYNVTLGAVTVSNATTLTYTAGSSLSESSTPETAAELGNKVVGGIDYWFGTSDNKTQYLITVWDNGAVYRTSGGARTRITDGGQAWTIPANGLTEANLEVYANRVIIAVSGVTNQMKYWDGDTGNPLRDLPGNLVLTSVSRASSGTTRTLVFGANVALDNGTTIVIGSSNASYAGTFTLVSGSGTNTITYTASSSLAEGTTADTSITIGIFAPMGLFLRQHQGFLFCNDKTNLDRLHYCGADTYNQWNGVGTSGSIDIAPGDGDPSGITGIAPTFKADLFVGKRTKLYRLTGTDPDTYPVIKQSDGIGFISHQAITAIDQDDVFFVSDKGLHSLATTNAYGDFTATFISSDIQTSFVEDWAASRRRYIKAAYLPEINSAAFAVTEDSGTYNSALWVFNIPNKEWYRWPDLECETLISAQDTDRRRVYLGTIGGRLAQTFTGDNTDTDKDGTALAVSGRASTGLIFVDGRPDTVKGFKRVMPVFKAEGSYSLTVKVKIDNFSEQAVLFTGNAGAVLGSFILGTDVLGASSATAPYSLPIDGYGRGVKLTVEQSDRNSGLAVQGILLEYDGGSDQPETRLGNDS